MNGQHKNGLVVGIGLFIAGIVIGAIASNKKTRDLVLGAVNDGYVAIKEQVNPKK